MIMSSGSPCPAVSYAMSASPERTMGISGLLDAETLAGRQGTARGPRRYSGSVANPFASAALVERVPRIVYRVGGERPLAYLHDVLAQDVSELREGTGAIAALLTAEGRVAAEVRVLPLEKDVLIDADEASRDGIQNLLVRHAGLAGCEVVDVTDEYAVAAIRGPDASVPGEPPSSEAAFVAAGDAIIVRVIWGVPGIDVLGPTGAVAEVLRTVDVPRASLEDLDVARIAAGRPLVGRDIDDTLLVNETPLLTHAVSLSKGCYPGQESVARVHNLGRVRRMLRGLTADAALEGGADLTVDGAVVGRITSAAHAPIDGFAAIALIRSEVEPGAKVAVDGGTASVTALP
jgi:folate-binding protein YgfZ